MPKIITQAELYKMRSCEGSRSYSPYLWDGLVLWLPFVHGEHDPFDFSIENHSVIRSRDNAAYAYPLWSRYKEPWPSSMYFDGNSAYLATNLIVEPKAHSVCCNLIKTFSSSTYDLFISQRGAGGDTFQLWSDQGTRLLKYWNGVDQVQSSRLMPDNKFIQLGCAHDGIDKVRLYIDGFDSESTITIGGASTETLAIQKALTNYARGRLSDVRIYQRQLSDAEYDEIRQEPWRAATMRPTAVSMYFPHETPDVPSGDLHWDAGINVIPGAGAREFKAPNKVYGYSTGLEAIHLDNFWFSLKFMALSNSTSFFAQGSNGAYLTIAYDFLRAGFMGKAGYISDSIVDYGVWNHIVFIGKRDSNISTYLNSTLQNAVIDISAFEMDDADSEEIFIGCHYNGTSYFEGAEFEIIYGKDYLPTQEDIDFLFNQGALLHDEEIIQRGGPLNDSIVHHWPMNEKNHSDPFYDVRNGNDAELVIAEQLFNPDFTDNINNWDNSPVLPWDVCEWDAGSLHLENSDTTKTTNVYQITGLKAGQQYRLRYKIEALSDDTLLVGFRTGDLGSSNGYSATHATSIEVDTLFTPQHDNGYMCFYSYRATKWKVDYCSIKALGVSPVNAPRNGQLPINDELVRSWEDKTPLGYDYEQAEIDLMASYRTQAIKKKPALLFEPDSHYTEDIQQIKNISKGDLWIVVQPSKIDAEHWVFTESEQAGANYLSFGFVNNKIHIRAGGDTVAQADVDMNISINTAYIIHVWYATTWNVEVNGSLKTLNLTGTPLWFSTVTNADTITIGQLITNSTPSGQFKGLIAEKIITPQLQTDQERQDTFEYLKDKYLNLLRFPMPLFTGAS